MVRLVSELVVRVVEVLATPAGLAVAVVVPMMLLVVVIVMVVVEKGLVMVEEMVVTVDRY